MMLHKNVFSCIVQRSNVIMVVLLTDVVWKLLVLYTDVLYVGVACRCFIHVIVGCWIQMYCNCKCSI